MSDTDQPRANKPTDKMLEFAKNIAKKLNQQIPDDVMMNFDSCRAYLDANKDAASRPSEKQLSFASTVAVRKGLTVPEDALANGKLLSQWLDANLQ